MGELCFTVLAFELPFSDCLKGQKMTLCCHFPAFDRFQEVLLLPDSVFVVTISTTPVAYTITSWLTSMMTLLSCPRFYKKVERKRQDHLVQLVFEVFSNVQRSLLKPQL